MPNDSATSLAAVQASAAARDELRRNTFLFQDGLMLSATLRGLVRAGVLGPIVAGGGTLGAARPDLTESGFGYMRVGLRCLASQGWLESSPGADPAAVSLRPTAAGRAALEHRGHYLLAGELLASFGDNSAACWAHPWPAERVELLEELVARARERWGLEELPFAEREVMLAHLDGAAAVPVMLSLLRDGALEGDAPRLPDGPESTPVEELLAVLAWTTEQGDWSEAGSRVRDVATVLGLAGSYLPMLSRLPDLYEGRFTVLKEKAGGPEWHVDRELNIAASAAAHSRYFTDADQMFADVFDRQPLSSQPRFVADTGCGDGSWLVHISRHVAASTLRGQHLGEHPLLMVGIDFNEAALSRARAQLEREGIDALLVQGDVSDPDGIASTLAAHGLEMQDGLHVRSFLDHDRRFLGHGTGETVPGWSSGAYVDAEGRPLAAADVERDLVAHLRRWTPHVRRHGLVVLEAHSVPPDVAARHVGFLHSVTFDAYHGLSHQYPIEHAAFVRCCRAAGLVPAAHTERRYPASRPFTAVSLGRLRARTELALPGEGAAAEREDTWAPGGEVDRADGVALHRLLYEDGDLLHPRLWCSAPTGWVVHGALDAIDERLASASPGEAIRVLDYGAGTGLAAIELLKGCRDRALEAELERREVTLELHLVDLPTAWFAQGYELLSGTSWTRFHSLADAEGGFRPLTEVVGERQFDVVMANMVFHLIPDRALARAVAGLAAVTRPRGRLVWNSPDLSPGGPWSLLFHDPNRELRRRWAERAPGEQGRADQSARAARRILPEPNDAAAVAAAIAVHYDGEVERRSYELLAEDSLDTLLVPGNQAEYLPEITDPAERERTIRELLLGEVLPHFQDGPAGTGTGLNVLWTLGSHRLRA